MLLLFLSGVPRLSRLNPEEEDRRPVCETGMSDGTTAGSRCCKLAEVDRLGNDPINGDGDGGDAETGSWSGVIRSPKFSHVLDRRGAAKSLEVDWA